MRVPFTKIRRPRTNIKIRTLTPNILRLHPQILTKHLHINLHPILPTLAQILFLTIPVKPVRNPPISSEIDRFGYVEAVIEAHVEGLGEENYELASVVGDGFDGDAVVLEEFGFDYGLFVVDETWAEFVLFWELFFAEILEFSGVFWGDGREGGVLSMKKMQIHFYLRRESRIRPSDLWDLLSDALLLWPFL